jgi:hypothetical protein
VSAKAAWRYLDGASIGDFDEIHDNRICDLDLNVRKEAESTVNTEKLN